MSREARRQAMLDSAVAVIRRRGLDTSIEHVATEVGVTRPIIYRYFGDADGLRGAVASRFADELLARLRAVLDRAGEVAGREVTAAAIDAYLAFIEREPEIYRYLVRGPREEIAAFAGAVGDALAGVIATQLRAAGADHRMAEPWAHGLVGMVHHAGDWWLAHRTMSRRRLARHLTTLVWDGMRSAQPPTGTQGGSDA